MGAVQQGKTFFGFQGNGFPSHFLVDFFAAVIGAFVFDLPHADNREAEVGQRHQVTGGAEGSLFVHHRINAVVVEVHKTLHRFHLHAGIAVRKGLDFQQEHQTDNFFRHFVSHAASVGHHQVLLQFAQILFRYGRVAKRSETGGHPINRRLLVFDFVV